MKDLEWDERLSVGFPDLDEEHRRLLRLCASVVRASSTGASEAQLRHVVTQLRTYVKEHFQREEELLHRYRYPRLNEHITEHMKLTQHVKELYFSGHKHEPIDPGVLKALLRDWVVEHIIRHDLSYAKYFKDHPPGKP